MSEIVWNGEICVMQRAAALQEIIHEREKIMETDAGEPDAMKVARPVRRGAVGKGPDPGHLADGLPNSNTQGSSYYDSDAR
ncbi:MAG: hypothetical protein ACRDTE_06365 [Pseudonocardiaceae bacterium]